MWVTPIGMDEKTWWEQMKNSTKHPTVFVENTNTISNITLVGKCTVKTKRFCNALAILLRRFSKCSFKINSQFKCIIIFKHVFFRSHYVLKMLGFAFIISYKKWDFSKSGGHSFQKLTKIQFTKLSWWRIQLVLLGGRSPTLRIYIPHWLVNLL